MTNKNRPEVARKKLTADVALVARLDEVKTSSEVMFFLEVPPSGSTSAEPTTVRIAREDAAILVQMNPL